MPKTIIRMTTTNAQRVAKARQSLVQRGGRRIPTGYIQPDAAQALEALVSAGYAPSAVGAISQALLDAQRKIARK